MDIAPLIAWAVGLTALLSFGTTVWNLVNSGSKRNATAIAELRRVQEERRARMDRHDARLVALENTLLNMPGKDDIHSLHLGMSDLRGDMREVRAVMDGNHKIMQRLEAIVTRHEDHLLDGKSR